MEAWAAMTDEEEYQDYQDYQEYQAYQAGSFGAPEEPKQRSSTDLLGADQSLGVQRARLGVGGLSRMIPFNVGDEIVAGGSALFDAALGRGGLSESYDNRLSQVRDYQDAFGQEAGNWATALDIGAGVGMPLGSAVSKVKGLLPKLGVLAAEGASLGGAYGYGGGEGSEDRLAEALSAAKIGAVVSPALYGGISGGASLLRGANTLLGKVTPAFRNPRTMAAEELAPSAKAIEALPDRVPGNPFYDFQTLAEATQSPRLAQLEQRVGKASEKANELLVENRAARLGAYDELAANLSAAPKRTAEEGGLDLRALLEKEGNQVRGKAEDLFGEIAPDGKIPVGPVNDAFRASMGKMYEAGGAPRSLTSTADELSSAARVAKQDDPLVSALFDARVRQIVTEAPAAVGDAVKPFSYMHSLRQRAQDAWLQAKSVGDNRAAATANGLVKQIDGAIEQAGRSGGMTPTDVSTFNTAKKAYADFAKTYQNGPVGDALRKMGEGNYSMRESNVVGRLFNGKAEGTKKLLAALPDTPAAIDDARGLVRDHILRETRQNDNLISPGKFRTYLRKNMEGLTAKTKSGKALFEEGHVKSLEQIADDIAFLDPSSSKSVKQLAYAASVGQPTTAQAMIMGENALASKIPFGRAIKAFTKDQIDKKVRAADDILAAAFFDKKIAKDLISTYTPSKLDAVRFAIAKSAKNGQTAAQTLPLRTIAGIGSAQESEGSGSSALPVQSYRKESIAVPLSGQASTIAPQANTGRLPASPQAGSLTRSSSSTTPSNVAALISEQPPLVQAIIRAESNGNHKAVSNKGAQGLMQLMPAIQKAFEVADPFDPAENIRGGVALIQEELERFGDPLLAIAAYNAGSPAVKKAIKLAGSSDYEAIRPYLPKETRNYVKRVISYA